MTFEPIWEGDWSETSTGHPTREELLARMEESEANAAELDLTLDEKVESDVEWASRYTEAMHRATQG